MNDSPELEAHERRIEVEPAWLELLDHTADAGVIVHAPNLPSLFERAAWAMFSVITDPSRVLTPDSTQLELEADDTQALLVLWLSELNYLHVTRHQLFGRFEVGELSERRIVSTARGEAIDAHRHTVYTEIKAVTYHDLAIERTGTNWRAQVIFDL